MDTRHAEDTTSQAGPLSDGGLDTSIEELLQSNAMQPAPKGGNHWQWFFLAMAHWQQGDKEEARRWFHQAVYSTAKFTNTDAELLRIRVEAEILLKMKSNQ